MKQGEVCHLDSGDEESPTIIQSRQILIASPCEGKVPTTTLQFSTQVEKAPSTFTLLAVKGRQTASDSMTGSFESSALVCLEISAQRGPEHFKEK